MGPTHVEDIRDGVAERSLGFRHEKYLGHYRDILYVWVSVETCYETQMRKSTEGSRESIGLFVGIAARDPERLPVVRSSEEGLLPVPERLSLRVLFHVDALYRFLHFPTTYVVEKCQCIPAPEESIPAP